jgi:hybrid cluster-associated redox disulfide protein
MITKEMPITDIVMNFPEVVPVFREYGLGCIGCMAARFENLDQGAQVHGIDIEQLVADLNAAVEQESC